MSNIEKQIAEEIVAANGLTVAKLGLRFDKVVVRLLGDIRHYVEQSALKKETIIMTITAPIKLSAKTGDEIKAQINNLIRSKIIPSERSVTVFQNKIRLRIIASASKPANKFIGMVHNKSTNPRILLDLMAQWLIKN